MQHLSSFLTLNQSSLCNQSKETQYFRWKQSETKYRNASADIRAVRQINQKDIVNWIIRLNPEYIDEVFSFTNKEHAMKILQSPNSEFLNFIKILSVNELFDTIAVINNKFVDYFLRMVEQYHLFLEQEIQIIKLQDAIILELRSDQHKMNNSTELLILKEFEKSIILRYFQEKDNCYYTSTIKTVSLFKYEIPFQKQQMEEALLKYNYIVANEQKDKQMVIDQQGQNLKKVDRDIILLRDLGFKLELLNIEFYEDHYQSKQNRKWFIKQFFGLPLNQMTSQTLSTFFVSSIMVQTQIASNYLDENYSQKNKNKKKSKQKQKSNRKRTKQSQPHICSDNCEVEKQSKNFVNSIFQQVYEQLESEYQPSVQKPAKKRHNNKIKELLQDDISQEIQLKNNEEFQLSDCNQKQTTISTTTLNSSSNSESDENYQCFNFNGMKEDNNDTFQKNKQNSSNNKKNKQIPIPQQPMSPQQNEEKQYSLSQQSTPIKQKKKLKINSDMKLPYKNTINNEKDLDDFSNSLIFRNCGYKNSKIVCFQRLQFIVNMILQATLVVYGSVATGLDLEDSDIDISIVGFEHYNYIQIQKQLQMLHNKLLEIPFVISAKLILGNIPLLKLELTPQGKFYESDYHVKANRNLYYLQQNEFTKIISVDLTWNTQWGPQYINQHNGFQSTSIINQWIYSYVGFRELILILKQLLKKRNLNDAFQGGISSYCLSIMLAAIYQIQVTQYNKIQTLLQFLDKYGNNFDPQIEGIDVCIYHQNPFIQLEESPTHPPLTVFSPVNKTIISNKATKINEILQEFKQFHQHLLQNNTIHEYFQNKH